MAAEDHHPDAVAAASGHKILDHAFDRLQPADDAPFFLEIESGHAFGQVQRQHDVDAFREHFSALGTPLGTRQATTIRTKMRHI
jgi:hypothetical protein